MELFNTLSPIDRVMFRQELVVAILKIVAKYFTHDSLGNELADEAAYYETLVQDFDPFSYFAELEGIGIEEPNFDELCDDEALREFEERMAKKYGDSK